MLAILFAVIIPTHLAHLTSNGPRWITRCSVGLTTRWASILLLRAEQGLFYRRKCVQRCRNKTNRSKTCHLARARLAQAQYLSQHERYERSARAKTRRSRRRFGGDWLARRRAPIVEARAYACRSAQGLARTTQECHQGLARELVTPTLTRRRP